MTLGSQSTMSATPTTTTSVVDKLSKVSPSGTTSRAGAVQTASTAATATGSTSTTVPRDRTTGSPTATVAPRSAQSPVNPCSVSLLTMCQLGLYKTKLWTVEMHATNSAVASYRCVDVCKSRLLQTQSGYKSIQCTQYALHLITSDKGGGKCVCPRSFVCSVLFCSDE